MSCLQNGALWLETNLWENLQWLECESILKDLTTSVCEGVKNRVISLIGTNTTPTQVSGLHLHR